MARFGLAQLIPTPTHRRLSAALLWTACLAGCATEPEPRLVTRIERVPVLHPPQLLECQPELPVPPSPRSVADTLGWVADLRAAGQDCREALACIRRRQVGEGC